jgi:hypothetical protein
MTPLRHHLAPRAFSRLRGKVPEGRKGGPPAPNPSLPLAGRVAQLVAQRRSKARVGVSPRHPASRSPLHQLRWSPSPANGRGPAVAPSRPKDQKVGVGKIVPHGPSPVYGGRCPTGRKGGAPRTEPPTNLSPRFLPMRISPVPRRAGAAQRTCGGGYRGSGSRPRRAAVRATGTWTSFGTDVSAPLYPRPTHPR